MREKLIELLNEAPTDYDGNRNVCVIADHLIANGVTVQKKGVWSLRSQTIFGNPDYEEMFYLECSECGRKVMDISQTKAACGYWTELISDFPYCHCGAKMGRGCFCDL